MSSVYEWTAWIVLGLSVIVAAVGTLAPAVPGAILVVVGALIHKFILPDVLSWWTLGGLGFLAFLSYVADFVSTMLGAKSFGASRSGVVGAGIGGLVGLFFFPLGLIVGPFLGAMVGEVVSGRDRWAEIFRSGVGASLGFVLSLVARLGILGLMVLILVADL